MQFLSPLFLFGAIAAAVPIVLHLLKREPEARLKFSAVKLLRRAPVEHTRRRHLNELLLLLLRVTALVLLALAFARPFFASAAASLSAGVTIVVLDTSLSLSAPGQFERARQLAREALDAVPSGDLTGVITFADAPQIAARPSGDRAAARAAIDRASPGFGGTRFRAALETAAGLADGRPATIVVVTDLQAAGWSDGDRAALPESARLEVRDVGAMPPDLAITAIRTAGDRTIAVVRNAGPAPRDAHVAMRVDGKPAGEATATVRGGEDTEVTLPGARGREVAVSVADPDGIEADNSRFLIVDESSRAVVLIVTATGDLGREGFYLRHAIAAAGRQGAAHDVQGLAGGDVARLDRSTLGRYAAIVVVSTRGLDRAGRDLLLEFTRGGRGLFIAAGPAVDTEVASGAVGGAVSVSAPAPGNRGADRSFAPVDARHPIFQPFGGGAMLGLVRFRRIAVIQGEACDTLARFSTGEAALLECAVGAGRVLAFASDLDNGWNDFPRHASFVPFVQEAIRHLAGPRAHSGEYLVGDAPAGVEPRPGFASIGGRPVAINVDPAETHAGRVTVAEFQSYVTRVEGAAPGAPAAAREQQEDRQRLWQYLLGLMVATLVVESVIGARTS